MTPKDFIAKMEEEFLNRFAVWNSKYVWAEKDGVQSKCTPEDVKLFYSQKFSEYTTLLSLPILTPEK